MVSSLIKLYIFIKFYTNLVTYKIMKFLVLNELFHNNNFFTYHVYKYAFFIYKQTLIFEISF